MSKKKGIAMNDFLLKVDKLSGQELSTRLYFLKIGTLMNYRDEKGVKKCYGCPFEFDVKDGKAVNLHIWIAPKNVRNPYKEKYHMEYSVPVEYQNCLTLKV